MSETFLLKNIYCPALIDHIATMVKRGFPALDSEAFKAEILPSLDELSLTERARIVSEVMAKHYPDHFPEVAPMLVKAFDDEGYHPGIVKYEEFRYLAFGNYVAAQGLNYFEESMEVLYELTKRFTAEFSVRPFIEQYPEKSLAQLTRWTSDDSLHVRRLVSEGTRTRLPWASRLVEFQKNPGPVLALLERLKHDKERYVQRSVANNLNDLAKDHPQTVIKRLKSWKGEDHPASNWIIKHASRTLVKAGHTDALVLLGYNPEAEVMVSQLSVSPILKFGENLEFGFDLKNTGTTSEDLVVDFTIHFVKANGKRSPKVFKLSEKKLGAGETVTISKKHSIKAISTRTYYAGYQKLEINVNGKVKAEAEFNLVMD